MSVAPAAVRSRLRGAPPQLYFVTGAISQYVGSALAVKLFASVPAAGVAWLRVLAAAVALVAWRRPWRSRWTAARLRLAALFGVTLALMNLTFYLAIDRLPLGTAVAIEFIGPITVAALGTRTRRDVRALVLATVGVILLADVHISGSPVGLALILTAAVLWAGYIVMGHRLAADPELRPQDGLATGMPFGAVALLFCVPQASNAFDDAGLLLACLGVGLMASVVPYALEQLAMSRLPRARFALLLSLLPATATLVGLVVLGQVPSLLEVVGIALVVIAAASESHTGPAPATSPD
jgi:inner membrane transporter RhtA